MTTEVRNDETELNQDELDAQDHADFAAGFAGTESEYDEPQEESTDSGSEDEAAATATATPAEEEGEQKPLTTADIDRIRLEAAADAEQKHLKRIRDLSGEVGGLKQKLEGLTTAKAAAESQGADAPTTKQIAEAAQSGSKLAALKNDFPEFAEALEEAIGSIKPAGIDPDALTQSKQAADQAMQQAESTAQELNTMRQMRQLDKAHPDWEEVITDNSYKQWLAIQNPQIQHAAANSNDARDAITILNLFKKSQNQSASSSTANAGRQANQRLENAISPTSGKQVARRDHKTEHDEFVAAFNSG